MFFSAPDNFRNNIVKYTTDGAKKTSFIKPAIAATMVIAQLMLLGACATGKEASKILRDKEVADKGVTITEFRDEVNLPADGTIEWWKRFSDATLDKLVQDARNEGISVQIAEQRLKQARAQGIATISGYAPTIGISSEVSQTSVIDGPKLYDAQTGTNSANRQATSTSAIGASWELPLFGRFGSSLKGARANVLNAEIGLEAAKIALVSDLAAAYFDLRSAQISLGYYDEDLARTKTLLNIAEERYRVGLISKTDLSLVQSQYATIATQIPDAKLRVRAALDRVSILRGVNPGALDSFLALNNAQDANGGFLFKANAPNLVSVPADYIRRRPDVLQAEQQTILQAANVGISKAAMYPNVTINGSVSLVDAAQGNPIAEALTRGTLTPAISLNLFDFGQRYSNLKVADAQFKQALLNYRLTALTALAEGQQALANYNQGLERSNAAVQGEEAALIRLKASEKSYEVGLISMKERVEAERDYSGARQTRLSAQAKYSDAAIGIYRTFAGSPEVIK